MGSVVDVACMCVLLSLQPTCVACMCGVVNISFICTHYTHTCSVVNINYMCIIIKLMTWTDSKQSLRGPCMMIWPSYGRRVSPLCVGSTLPSPRLEWLALKIAGLVTQRKWSVAFWWIIHLFNPRPLFTRFPPQTVLLERNPQAAVATHRQCRNWHATSRAWHVRPPGVPKVPVPCQFHLPTRSALLSIIAFGAKVCLILHAGLCSALVDVLVRN